MATPDEEILASVSGDPEVKEAAKAVILKAIAQVSFLMDQGKPERQDKMLSIVAAPVIREVINPRSKSQAEIDEEVKQATADFHDMRRKMVGEDSDAD